ncbi:hypothetical protein [Sandaracinus amylolyticus]|uniref:Lipoprotein n=1 Tax=Sandaracinus amylolyticus TaxID=927083 RepID=A0A0F6SFM2_9BACT|nr:hypothetical protein [Sandaracinus amylolyticus]AKF07189.1 hypothetical protein DB32_004338 [Sandaracinus amylolyticus]
MRVCVALLVAVLFGCTSREPLGGDAEASLVVRDGAACATGCALDTPVLVGAELVADVVTTVELDGIEARAIDGATMSAWVEPVRLCCGVGEGASCFRMHAAAVTCGGEETTRPRVVMRALRVGETAIEVADGEDVIGTVPVRVEDAIEVNVVSALSTTDAPDVMPGAIDGRMQSIALRAGQAMRVSLVAIGPDGARLLASGAPSARIADTRVASVSPASGVCSGEVADGPLVQLEGVASGQTALTVRAGSASATLPVVVSAGCDGARVEPSDVACESDADCAPVACCHASACGAASDAPSCQGEACTLECREGTLDCGGRCLCLEGRCAAYIASMDPECEPPVLPPIDVPF